jgi:hypothetical protein
MKTQTNPTIKAHLLRGAFYLLLLLAVYAIPFALAQPGSIVTGIPTSSGLAPSPTCPQQLLIRQLPDSRLRIASRIRVRSKTFTGVTGSGQTRTPAPSQQQKEIQALTANLKEQASQIQKVSAQLEVSKPPPQIVINNP